MVFPFFVGGGGGLGCRWIPPPQIFRSYDIASIYTSLYEILPAKNSRVQAQLVQKASFSKMAGLRLKVYVISDANTRKSDRGTFFNTIAYEENGKTIKTVQYSEKFRLQKEIFYLLINVSVVEDTVRLNDTSKVSNYIH